MSQYLLLCCIELYVSLWDFRNIWFYKKQCLVINELERRNGISIHKGNLYQRTYNKRIIAMTTKGIRQGINTSSPSTLCFSNTLNYRLSERRPKEFNVLSK